MRNSHQNVVIQVYNSSSPSKNSCQLQRNTDLSMEADGPHCQVTRLHSWNVCSPNSNVLEGLLGWVISNTRNLFHIIKSEQTVYYKCAANSKVGHLLINWPIDRLTMVEHSWSLYIKLNHSWPCYNPSQKSLATLRRKPSPASPLSMLLQWCRLFFWYFFEPAKQHWAGGMGEKQATGHPMLLSEIVWKSYVKYVVSFYVMWISTLLLSHVRARLVQRWRCTMY